MFSPFFIKWARSRMGVYVAYRCDALRETNTTLTLTPLKNVYLVYVTVEDYEILCTV